MADTLCPKCHGACHIHNPNWEPGAFNYEPYWVECDLCHGTGQAPVNKPESPKEGAD